MIFFLYRADQIDEGEKESMEDCSNEEVMYVRRYKNMNMIFLL
jgi:hypothetical protein